MKSIKMRGICAAVTGALLFGFGANAMADSTTDIVNALVAKGVLTEEEGALLNKGREGEAAGQAKALKKAGKLTVSDAIDNAQVYGDVRVRYERRDGTGNSSGTTNVDTQEVNRSRYKFTLGVKTEAKDWYSDFAVAASSKGTSDNVTMGTSPVIAGSGINPKTGAEVYVKRAQVGYKPFDWLAIEAGKMANPLYSVNAMVFDKDIVFDGLQEKLKYKFGETEVFANLGQWLAYNNYSDLNGVALTNASTVMAYQAGVNMPLIDKKASVKGAVSFYQYGGYGGTKGSTVGNYTPFLSNATRANSVLVAAAGSSLGTNDLQILDIPAEINYMVTDSIGAKLYGEYVNNLAGSDRYNKACALNSGAVCGLGDDHDAWLVGLTISSAKDLKSVESGKGKAGDWSANLWYQSVGAYALDPSSVDSDIFDGRVNMEGLALKAQYLAQDNVSLNFTGAWGSRKNENLASAGSGGDIALNLKDLNLYQFDVTYKW